MRGKHDAGVYQFDIPGITHAHAGKTKEGLERRGR